MMFNFGLVTALFAASSLVLVDAMPTFKMRSPFQHRSKASPLPVKRDDPPPPNPNPKLVVAHHMVGNTYPYTPQDWADDIQDAHDAGIDGFALNIGTDEWQPKQVAAAYVQFQFLCSSPLCA